MITNLERAGRRMRQLLAKNGRQALGLRSGYLAVVLYDAWCEDVGRLRVVRISGFAPWNANVCELRSVAAAVLGHEHWRAGELLQRDDGECRRPSGRELAVGGKAGWFGGAAYWAALPRDWRGPVCLSELDWYEPKWVRWLDEKLLGAPIGQNANGSVSGPGVNLIRCAE